MLKISVPRDYMEQLFSKLNLDISSKKASIRFVEEMQKSTFHIGKNPLSIAATCIYLGCRETGFYIIQRKIASVSGVTEVTIRNILKGYILSKE